MYSLKKNLTAKHYVMLPLVLTQTSHFEVEAEINGISGRFIVDTGASDTCVDTDKMDHFKMVSETSAIQAAGAGATAMETALSKGNTIALGEWKRSDQALVLFNLVHVNQALLEQNSSPVDGVIGADILVQGKAVIDYGELCLYLKRL